jgi:hypothetical protein
VPIFTGRVPVFTGRVPIFTARVFGRPQRRPLRRPLRLDMAQRGGQHEVRMEDLFGHREVKLESAHALWRDS